MKISTVLFLFCFIFAISNIALASDVQEPVNPVVSINALSSDYQEVIENLFSEKILIKEIIYDIDGRYLVEDIQCFLGFSSGMILSKEKLLNALFYIKQLKIFKEIKLDLIPVLDGVYNLKLFLRQNTLVDYFRVDGFLRNKQRIKNLYMIENGDIFDLQKHQYSLECMKNHFKQQGYLKAAAYDTVLPLSEKKDVLVACAFALGNKFRIKRVITRVNTIKNLDDIDNQHIYLQISDFFTKRLEGKKYTEKLIESAKKRMQATLTGQGFLDVSINVSYEFQKSENDIFVTIDVNLEKKREFVFWGNKFFKNSEILSHLLLYGKSAWYFPLFIIEDEIETLYKDKGFFDVKIIVREDGQRIFCSIDQGVRSKVSSVSVVGSFYSSVNDLITSAFKPYLKASYYDKDLLKKSLNSFIKMYKAAGFWDVKVLNQELVFLPDTASYEYVLTIDEGSCRKLGVHYFKNHKNIEEEFLKAWNHKHGQGFDETLLSEQKNWLIKYFKNQGFSAISISYELVQSSSSVDLFDVFWNIQISKSFIKFGQPIILGNSSASYAQLLKECEFKSGDSWQKNKLDQTLQNFKDMHIFDSVQIYPSHELDLMGCKPVFIKLQEIERFENRFTFGLQQMGRNWQLKRGFTYKVGASIGINRLFTPVDKFSVYGDLTRFYRDIGVTYDVPWIKSSRVRCQFKGYDVLYQKPVYVGSDNILYKATRQGFMWNATRNFENFSVSASLGTQFLGLYEQDQPSLNTIIKYDKKLLGQKIGYIFCEPNFIFRSVDNELNPRKGCQSFVSCKIMFDCNHKTTFYKVNLEHTQYLPVASAATLALRARCGHVFNQSFDQLHPIERFYLGGGSSVRGYMIDYCPPLGALTNPIYDPHAGLPPCANDIWRYAPQGGRTMFNLNAEIRFEVYKNLGFVLFTDWGALMQDSISKKIPGQPRNFAGSGAGARYDTPIGPLRFDVGLKWNIEKPDFESRQVWYISLGQAF